MTDHIDCCPTGPAQTRVIAAALQASDLQPSDIASLQMHGTGMLLYFGKDTT